MTPKEHGLTLSSGTKGKQASRFGGKNVYGGMDGNHSSSLFGRSTYGSGGGGVSLFGNPNGDHENDTIRFGESDRNADGTFNYFDRCGG